MGANSKHLTEGLVHGVLLATEAAAVAAAGLAGRGDEKEADRVAVEAMRKAFNHIEMAAEIVIGEGERDEAPMLFIGEQVGTGKGMAVDIAVDPLEGTTLTAKAMANALAVVAVAPKGGLLNAPDVYMEKVAIGGGFPEGVIALDKPPAELVRDLAKAKKTSPQEIVVCVLDRPRHAELIAEMRSAGAKISLISDGDVAGAMHTANPASPIDMYIGTGGAPEGVLAAAALSCLGGQMEARLVLDSAEKQVRAKTMKIDDPHRIFTLKDLVLAPAAFIASGVTDGSLLRGVRFLPEGWVEISSLVLTRERHQHIRTRLPVGALQK